MRRTTTVLILVTVFTFLICLMVLFRPIAAAPTSHGMVVSEHKLASAAGLNILKAGGNAIDAAVAVGYALAVVNPCCGNIGGGGFMTIHLANGENIFLNFREKAPLAAQKNMYLDKQGNVAENITTKGYLAVGVPGTVLGLDTALQKYGTMTREQVMAPAIKLAKEGYRVTFTESKWLQKFAPDFREQPNIAAIFFHKGKPLTMGGHLVQSDLAHTLELIAKQGSEVFYRGSIAAAIVTASKAHGGILTLKDFNDYTVEELKPIQCDYRGFTIISAPPPSSGGVTLCEMLNILDNFDLKKLGYHTSASTIPIVEAMYYGFTDRNSKLGDPNFIHNPVDHLLSKSYALELYKKILAHPRNMAHKPTSNSTELTDTTHYSIIDAQGNAVSVTYTLNGFFGARVMADHTGFFLNDEMDDFATQAGRPNKFGLVQLENNAIQPGKRPLSSMAPTIVMKNDKVFLVLGSPGGPRIISAVLLTLLNLIDYDITLQRAVNAPRFHYQGLPDEVDIEPFSFTYATTKELKKQGYHIVPQRKWAAVEAILVNPNDGTFEGANDYRRPDGAAVGY